MHVHYASSGCTQCARLYTRRAECLRTLTSFQWNFHIAFRTPKDDLPLCKAVMVHREHWAERSHTMVDILVLVAILVVLASVISGLTSFGDAIVFHVMWAVAAALGEVASDRASLAHAVLLTVIMGVANIPPQLFFAWGKLRVTIPYGFVASITGTLTVPLGAQTLYFGELTGVKTFIGIFFALFAGGQLTASLVPPLPLPPPPEACAMGEGGDAVVSQGGTADPAPPPLAAVQPVADGVAATPACVDADLVTAQDWVVDLWPGRLPVLVLQPLSQVYGVKATLLILLCTGAVAGFLSGMLGVAGPPLMIAFAVLGFDKDTIRAIKISYTLFELPSRVVMFTGSRGNVFDASARGDQYAVAVVASLVGNLCGTWLRQFADTGRILQLLFVLTLLSSSILLGALESAVVAASFAAVVTVWALAVAYWRVRPGTYHAGVACARAGVGRAWRVVRGGRGGA